MVIFIAVAAPLLTVSLYFYLNNENALRKNLLFDMESQTSYFLRNMEMEYERIWRMQRNLLSDINLNDLVNLNLYLSDYQRTVIIWSLQEKLIDFKNSSDYIDGASIYIPSISAVISAPSGGRYIYDRLSVNFTERLASIREAIERHEPLYEGQLTLFLLPQPRLTAPDTLSSYGYMIEVTLSHAKIARGLADLNTGRSGGFFLFDRQTGDLVASSGGSEMFPALLAEWQTGGTRLQIDNTSYLLIGESSGTMGLTLLGYADENTLLGSLRLYRWWMWIGVFMFLFITIIYTYSIQKYINQPIYLLLNHFRLLENGDLTTHIEAAPHNEFGVLYRQFNGMVDKLNSVIVQAYHQTIYTQRAELKQLQAQINPHFLYNSYFLLHRLIKRGDPYAVEFSRFLGAYFQYITENSADMVELHEEASHALLYAQIQSVRFTGRIRVEFGKVPPEMEMLKVPRLMLQPVLENAYLHGLEDKEEDGLLRVEFEALQDEYSICVSNNGKPLGDGELEKINGMLKNVTGADDGGALLNIHRRLRLAFGEGSGLEVTDLDGWVKVRLMIRRGSGSPG